MDAWDQNGSTSGPTPWKIDDDDDDDIHSEQSKSQEWFHIGFKNHVITEYSDSFICNHAFRWKNHILPLSDFHSA